MTEATQTDATTYPPGTFCWVDLATTDTEAATRFYGELFGWEAEEQPGAGGVYTMLRLGGRDVGALYELPEQLRAAGVPPHWAGYVSVADAEASAARARELGGTVLDGPTDAEGHGRRAAVQDPTGAFFVLWQRQGHAGAAVVNEPGSLCWNELYSSDAQAAAAFYGGLFGWSTEESASADGGIYTVFRNGEQLAAGMLQIREEWGAVPPSWAVYFAVADLDATLAKARELGATIQGEPMEVNAGRFAFLADPQGAGFAVMQIAPGAV
jgi:predicted enzyme related to lactoylglutathione lyase